MLAFLESWWPNVLTAIGTALVGVTAAANANGEIPLPLLSAHVPKEVLLYPGLGILVIGMGGQAKQQQDAAQLERERDRARRQLDIVTTSVENLAFNELYMLSKTLRHLSSERASLFLRAGDSFKLVSRYSLDGTLYSKPVGAHEAYPSDQGCLGRAWSEIEVFRTNLPNPASQGAWLDVQEREFRIPNDVARQMRMKSRTYAAFRITEDSGIPLGVIVFESTLTETEANVSLPHFPGVLA